MKILKSSLFILSIIIITIIFALLTPSLWQNKIEDQLNKQLSNRGDWKVKFHKLKGHMLFNISIDSLYLMRGYLVMNNQFQKKFFDICFDSYWKDNIDISNEKNLNKILEIIGLDKKEFFENIQDTNIKEKLKKLTNNAFEKDIFGAPTFVVNNKIFWGQDRLDYALDEYNS